MNMSEHVVFDAPQTSDLAETMAKRRPLCWKGLASIDLGLDSL